MFYELMSARCKCKFRMCSVYKTVQHLKMALHGNFFIMQTRVWSWKHWMPFDCNN